MRDKGVGVGRSPQHTCWSSAPTPPLTFSNHTARHGTAQHTHYDSTAHLLVLCPHASLDIVQQLCEPSSVEEVPQLLDKDLELVHKGTRVVAA